MFASTINRLQYFSIKNKKEKSLNPFHGKLQNLIKKYEIKRRIYYYQILWIYIKTVSVIFYIFALNLNP
jgi:hypothetical protein